MDNNYKDQLRAKTLISYQITLCIHGINKILCHWKPKFVLSSYIISITLCSVLLQQYIQTLELLTLRNMMSSFYDILYPVLVTIGAIFITIKIGTPKNANNIHEDFYRIGLNNHIGEVPLLLSNITSPDDSDIKTLLFLSNGIPKAVWEDFQGPIEAILNVYIYEINQGYNNKVIELKVVDANNNLPTLITWKPEYLLNDDFTLVLGMSLTGHVCVNLSKIPHILIGGSTGSGKSILFKLLLMQCVNKGAEVYIADFKGGVDFSHIWHDKCNIVTDEVALLDILTKLVDELERRKEMFKNASCANISEYNKYLENIPRIIFGCDEIAEVLDKTGLSKEKKDTISKIENKLSVIARQGRALGIHMIIATQRPDANILPGQIRSNIDFRVCGRADNILSQIILDKADANDKIPKNSQGLFLTNTDVVFRGYMFDDRDVFV